MGSWGDGDGVLACNAPDNHVLQAGDCDDANAEISPSVLDLCDGEDQDCDGLVDDDATFRLTFRDADGDGFGTADDTLETCGADPGYVAESGDCDDTDSTIGPAQIDSCDGVDTNCNGTVDDDAVFALYFPDDDGDGFGRADEPLFACGDPVGFAIEPGDCVDSDPSIAPGETDVCDEADNDCDGLVDEDAPATLYFEDADGDGVGRSDVSISTCQPSPFGYVTTAGDCDDTDPNVLLPSWYLDADGDGHGAGPSVQACTAPLDHVALGDDCDDSTNLRSPSLSEVCNNGVDDDCSAETKCRFPVEFELPSGHLIANDPEVSVKLQRFVDGPEHDLFVSFEDSCLVYSGLIPNDVGMPFVTMPARCGPPIGDLNGDGVPESAYIEDNGLVNVYFSGGSGVLAPSMSITDIDEPDDFDIRVAAVDLPTLGPGLLIATEGPLGADGRIDFVPAGVSGALGSVSVGTIWGSPGDRLGRYIAFSAGVVTLGSATGTWLLTEEEVEDLLGTVIDQPTLHSGFDLFVGSAVGSFLGQPVLFTISPGVVPFSFDLIISPAFSPQSPPILQVATPTSGVYLPIGDIDNDGAMDVLLRPNATDIAAYEIHFGNESAGLDDSPAVVYSDLFSGGGQIYTFAASPTSQFELALNGDGYDDFAVITRTADDESLIHYVYGTGQ
jgi:hypothetical protein